MSQYIVCELMSKGFIADKMNTYLKYLNAMCSDHSENGNPTVTFFKGYEDHRVN